MKKIYALILSIMLAGLMIMPVSAKEMSEMGQEDSYATLENVVTAFWGKEITNAVRFSDLSEEEKSFLRESDIDSDRIGKLYFPENEDEMTLTAIYLLEDNQFAVSMMTGFSQSEDGEYIRESPLAPVNRDWTATSHSGYDNYLSSQLIIYACLYSEYSVISSELYIRPYAVSHWYTNKTGYNPTVTNFTARGYVSGGIYSYSGSSTSYLYAGDWEKINTVYSPHAGTHYLAVKNMESNTCIGNITDFLITGSISINGQLRNYTITPAYDH